MKTPRVIPTAAVTALLAAVLVVITASVANAQEVPEPTVPDLRGVIVSFPEAPDQRGSVVELPELPDVPVGAPRAWAMETLVTSMLDHLSRLPETPLLAPLRRIVLEVLNGLLEGVTGPPAAPEAPPDDTGPSAGRLLDTPPSPPVGQLPALGG